jgi:hypothetical protein
MPDQFIYETIVYCGRTKVHRILNLNTGTLYSSEYDNELDARLDIKDGEVRCGKTVKFIDLFTLREKA